MSTDLPRSGPADQQVDPAAVLTFVDAVDADPEIELHSVMVLRRGHVIAEGWWSPHTPERARLLYSLSKSFTSTAFGMAVEEGLVGPDDTVVSHFPEFAEEITDTRSRSMTLRHLASMASGHDREMMHEAMTRDPQEPVRGFLLIPPDHEPGTHFAYSQPCTYTLASVLQRAAGMRLTDYLRPRLFDPLGIGDVGWLTWPPGRDLGFSGLFARTEDVAKLGQLYLQRGRWGDRQLIPESYVADATSRQVDNPGQGSPDWEQGYGFQFWMSRHGFRGDGAFGQFCVVLPEQDAVIATTGGTEAMQAVLDHLWTHLLPGLGSGRREDDDDHDDIQAELEERLAGLRLPACTARPHPTRWEDWSGQAFRVETPRHPHPASAFTSVALRRTGDGFDVTLAEVDNAVTFPVGTGDWLTSASRDRNGDAVPLAASGGWLDDGTLRVEVVFLDSPHRIDITCSLPERAAEARWRHLPLDGGRLEALHRPT